MWLSFIKVFQILSFGYVTMVKKKFTIKRMNFFNMVNYLPGCSGKIRLPAWRFPVHHSFKEGYLLTLIIGNDDRVGGDLWI